MKRGIDVSEHNGKINWQEINDMRGNLNNESRDRYKRLE